MTRYKCQDSCLEIEQDKVRFFLHADLPEAPGGLLLQIDILAGCTDFALQREQRSLNVLILQKGLIIEWNRP